MTSLKLMLTLLKKLHFINIMTYCNVCNTCKINLALFSTVFYIDCIVNYSLHTFLENHRYQCPYQTPLCKLLKLSERPKPPVKFIGNTNLRLDLITLFLTLNQNLCLFFFKQNHIQNTDCLPHTSHSKRG